ncbi:hypothetical protein A6J69_020850 [Hafnia paralvei]|nr:hypothetical protein A6J69_020850 [Hafnia paralvei]
MKTEVLNNRSTRVDNNHTDPRDCRLAALPENRIEEEAVFTYHYDVYGNLVEKVCKAMNRGAQLHL